MRLRFAADDRLVALVRGGDPTAFEILYDRHIRELLSFCRYMLGSHADAEDAVQSTFASAHRALLADDRSIDVRPWLFTIARNACLSILRARRPVIEAVGASSSREDPVARVEQREDMRQMLATLLELPESQRTALVLSELHGFSQAEIGALLGVRPEQVKSYIYQARSNLISEREARSADCRVIREEIAAAHGSALLKSRLRRHLRSCPGCREYAADVARQRHHLGILLPVAPTLALKRRALEAALGKASGSGTHAGSLAMSTPTTATTTELVSGGAKALMAKVLVGVACVGAGTGVATVVLGIPVLPVQRTEPTAIARITSKPRLASFVRAARDNSTQAAHRQGGRASTSAGAHGSQVVAAPQHAQAPDSRVGGDPVTASAASSEGATSVADEVTGGEVHGKNEKSHGNGEAVGKSEEPHGKAEEPHGKAEEPHGKSEEPHGKAEEPHGKSEEPHGKSEEAPVNSSSEEAPEKSSEAHGKGEEEHGKAKGE